MVVLYEIVVMSRKRRELVEIKQVVVVRSLHVRILMTKPIDDDTEMQAAAHVEHKVDSLCVADLSSLAW